MTATTAPTTPAHVLPGLMCGASLRLPNARPAKYAAVSATQTMNSTDSSVTAPSRRKCTSATQAAAVSSTASTVDTPRGMRTDIASGRSSSTASAAQTIVASRLSGSSACSIHSRHHERDDEQRRAEDDGAGHGLPARPADELHPLAEGRRDDRRRQEFERDRRPGQRADEQREQDDGGDDPLLQHAVRPRSRPALRRPARPSCRSGAAAWRTTPARGRARRHRSPATGRR